MDSGEMQDYTIGLSNGYIELRSCGVLATRHSQWGLSDLTVKETLRVLVGRFEATGGHCSG